MRYVLIIEDSSVHQLICKQILKDKVYAVIVGSAEEAKEYTDVFVFDLIITDLVLPDMSGAEFLTLIKKSKYHKYTPVVVVSGTQEYIDEAMKMGAMTYLLKPYKPADIIGVIERVYPDTK